MRQQDRWLRVQQWWGKDYSALKRLALRAVACGNVLSLALESNLSRSFSSFPMGQNIEYRRIIGLRCFLRRWWWGKDYSALKRLALRAVACGNVLSLALESNLSRSFSSFPMGQNIEYRRIIGLRCFLRRWWWGKDYSALKRLALRAVACGNVLSLALESNLSRSFSSFPMGQNIEYRRIIGLRCFLRRWWWGKDSNLRSR